MDNIYNHGDKLLIIFDGWDELNIELRQTSLAAQIIRKESYYTNVQ